MSLGGVAIAGLLVSVAACTSLRSVQTATLIPGQSPRVVWVTDTNNAIVSVLQPAVTNDTLRGMREGTQQSVAIPLDQIRAVRARLPDGAKTALLITALGVGTASSLYFAFGSLGRTGGVSVDCTRSDVVNHPADHPECSS